MFVYKEMAGVHKHGWNRSELPVACTRSNFQKRCVCVYIYIYIYIYIYSDSKRGYMYDVTFRVTVRTRWRSWLRHCTISRKVACSIPDAINGTFR